MKHLLLSLFLSCIVAALQAATVADGYMVTKNNDTLKCKVKVNGLANFNKVTIIDSSGNDVVYSAKKQELAGFGFTYRVAIYLIEAPDNRRITIQGGFSSFFRVKVRDFLGGDAVLVDLFNSKVNSIHDIPEFVKEANGL